MQRAFSRRVVQKQPHLCRPITQLQPSYCPASIRPPALVRSQSSWSIAGAHYEHWTTSLGNFVSPHFLAGISFGVTPFFGGYLYLIFWMSVSRFVWLGIHCLWWKEHFSFSQVQFWYLRLGTSNRISTRFWFASIPSGCHCITIVQLLPKIITQNTWYKLLQTRIVLCLEWVSAVQNTRQTNQPPQTCRAGVSYCRLQI